MLTFNLATKYEWKFLSIKRKRQCRHTRRRQQVEQANRGKRSEKLNLLFLGDKLHNEKKSEGKSNIGIHLASGALAGAIAKTFIAPLDRTKINFQIK